MPSKSEESKIYRRDTSPGQRLRHLHNRLPPPARWILQYILVLIQVFFFSSLGDKVVMAGLDLARLVLNANPPTSLSQELGLQVCVTKPRAEAPL